jgi:hypothetical protein
MRAKIVKNKENKNGAKIPILSHKIPATASKLSIIFKNPKFSPLSLSVDKSAIIASLGADLIFPALSKILNEIKLTQFLESV